MSHAFCGGPSEPKPLGQALNQILTPDAVVDLVAGSTMAWFSAYVYGAGYLTFNLTNLCQFDPPALPNVDGPRLLSYVASSQGAVYLRNDALAIVGYLIWNLYCQCSSGTTPPMPPPLPAPTGVSLDQPGQQSLGGTACASGTLPLQNAVFPANGVFQWGILSTVTLTAAQQWYTVSFDGLFADSTTAGFPIVHTIQYINSNNSIFQTDQFTQTAPNNFATAVPHNFPLPPGTVHVSMSSYTATAGSSGYDANAAFSFFCTPVPTAVMSACCPPDPSLMALLQQVLQFEQLILASLPGPKAPYVDSTVHAGLSGTGTVPISPSAAAIRVDITAGGPFGVPNPYQPPYLLSVGFVTPYAVGTPLRGSRLVYAHQTFPLESYVDQYGYGLEPGVTINIVELVTG